MKLEGRHVFLAVALALVAGAVGGGLFIMGSPADERMRNLDGRRIQDLRGLSRWVDVYRLRHSRLPESLGELASEPGMVAPAHDPVTGAAYEYAAKGPEQYTLCAVFAGGSTDEADFWSHGAGRQCFEMVANKIIR